MSWRRVTAVVTLALTAGCSSLLPVPVEFINEASPQEIQIYDGYRMMVIASPRLSGDSVLGSMRGADVAIPLREVQLVRAVRFNRGRTVLFAGGLAMIGGLAAYAFLTNANGHSTWSCDYNEPTLEPERPSCGFDLP